MQKTTNQQASKKLNRLNLNKETIADLEITRQAQDEVKGGASYTVVPTVQSIIGPKTQSARCSDLCK